MFYILNRQNITLLNILIHSSIRTFNNIRLNCLTLVVITKKSKRESVIYIREKERERDKSSFPAIELLVLRSHTICFLSNICVQNENEKRSFTVNSKRRRKNAKRR